MDSQLIVTSHGMLEKQWVVLCDWCVEQCREQQQRWQAIAGQVNQVPGRAHGVIFLHGREP